MKLYDFSAFAQKRAERKAAQEVADTAEKLHEPGSVIELKNKVSHWFNLHKEVSKLSA